MFALTLVVFLMKRSVAEKGAPIGGGVKIDPRAYYRPLRETMCVGKAVYKMAKKFRAERSGRVIDEPNYPVPLTLSLQKVLGALTDSSAPP